MADFGRERCAMSERLLRLLWHDVMCKLLKPSTAEVDYVSVRLKKRIVSLDECESEGIRETARK